ncbi:MAG TPA: DUF5658 family protein [Fimbriimonadaceae bacterium]|nr:DUF5658 family protein [Fimbriimonadaceae bacterium]
MKVAKLVPSRAIYLLLGIGLIDLIATAVLHAQGRIVELNPIMKPVIEHSEWSFVFVKGLTLVAAMIGLTWYGRQNPAFVRKACIAGSIAYIGIFALWFFKGA